MGRCRRSAPLSPSSPLLLLLLLLRCCCCCCCCCCWPLGFGVCGVLVVVVILLCESVRSCKFQDHGVYQSLRPQVLVVLLDLLHLGCAYAGRGRCAGGGQVPWRCRRPGGDRG